MSGLRPRATGRFGRRSRPGSGFGWSPAAGTRSPSPYGPGLPGEIRPGYDGEGRPKGRTARLLGAPFRRVGPSLGRRAAVWRRSPLIKGRWLPRSRLGRLGVALLSVVTAGAGLWATVRSSALDVDHIEVTGAVALGPEVARTAAGIETGDPLFSVDLAAARAAVEALPQVLSARVSRGFPNRVEIRVTERQPVAVVARPTGGFAVLDGTGRVVGDQAERPAALPEVSGAGSAPAAGLWLTAADPVLDVVASLPEVLRASVTQATLTGEQVTLVLLGGPGATPGQRREVRIGRAEELPAKASALVAVLERLGPRPVAYVDVRVPGAPVVGPIPAPTPVPAPPPAAPQ